MGTGCRIGQGPSTSEIIDKLVYIARGDVELVTTAIRRSSRLVPKEVRCGFFWLRTRTELIQEAPLEKIVQYILTHRHPLPQRKMAGKKSERLPEKH